MPRWRLSTHVRRGAAGALATAVLLAALALPSSATPPSSEDMAPGEQGDTNTADVTFRVTVPGTTPEDAKVYIAGNFQGWNPGGSQHRLSAVGDATYEITIPFEPGRRIEFKFTMGDWGTVEKGPNIEEISNRTLTVSETAVVELAVANWANDPAHSTITGNVSKLEVPGFLDGRRAWIYLPPGYESSPDLRYPVLYMLDGQNAFDRASSFAGEWEVDETCERLIAAGEIRPIIVVAVANGEMARSDEYTPWVDTTHRGGDGGGGDAHLREFIGTLLPFVDGSFRTLTGPANTGISGSSLGGLITVYAVCAYPQAFGLGAALSPYIPWDEHHLLRCVNSRPKPDAKLYVDMGTREWGEERDGDGDGVDDSIGELRALSDVLVAKGFVLGEDLMVVEDEGARHHETYWAARFPGALRFLFPPE